MHSQPAMRRRTHSSPYRPRPLTCLCLFHINVCPTGPAQHAVIVKTIATNICGSDLHMYRGRTDFPTGLAFGHEITGEVVECGSEVTDLKVGDWISVPFNISCGTCTNCKERKTNFCMSVNKQYPGVLGGAYGSEATPNTTARRILPAASTALHVGH